MKSKGLDTLQAGDVVSLRLPGAGGYGDPSERDPSLVLKDVRDGKVTQKRAADEYGVKVPEAVAGAGVGQGTK
jgi:N-methylhydantoinase B